MTSFKYDAYGNVTEKTNPDKTINITEYDGLQREKATYFKWKAEAEKQILTSTEYEFVKHGFNVYTALDSCSSKSCSGLKTIKKTYITAEKQVLTETLADFRGNPVTEKTNGETKRTSAYYANGQLARQTDALRNTTKYEYNYLNKLTKIEAPFDSEDSSVTTNKYDKNGNIVEVIQNVDNGKDSITQNKYNAMGLLEQVTLSGTDSKDKNISKYFYNNAGVQVKMYTGMSSENDSTYLTTNYEYDNWLRAVRTTDSTGYNSGTITYDLNGNVLTNTDANGNVTTNTYDALNRVLTSNTVNSKDSSKNVSKSYEYDSMGRITKTVSNEITTTTIYDSLGRKYTEGEHNKNGYSIFRGYFYEGVSQYVREELTGLYHLLFYSDKTYEYDSEMRLIKVKETGEETVSYTYDRNGNKKSETLANGVVSTYDYNNANRIVKLVNKKGNSTISSYKYSYYLDGSDACKVTEENGIIETTEYEYDGLKRLAEESVAKGNNTDTYSYEYDDYGNRSKMTATGSENYVTEYNYNNAQGKYTALLQKEVKTVEGEANPIDLNSNVKQIVYTYDANGNQITKTAEGKTETNTYDSLNQLIGFTDGETTASYKYNASGLRYEKTVDGQTINHVWDGNKQIVADVIDNQFYEADCYIRGTNLVAKYNYWNGKKTEYTYYTQNAHGDVVNLTDKDGKVTKSYRYDAFGVEKNIDENDTNAFRYCGEYFDKETATVYLRARYYNPGTGRFISRDSFAGRRSDPLSLNLYTYCKNNPIRYVDPSGHDAVAAAQYMVSNNLNGSRPTKCNSDWDCKLMKKWDTYYEKLAAPSQLNVNSQWDAQIREMTISGNASNPANQELAVKLNSAFKEACNTVVAKEGKTNNNNRRFNATITVNSLNGTTTSFVGSTLPDDFNYWDNNGEPSVAVDSGIYKMDKVYENGEPKLRSYAQYYTVSTLDGGDILPSVYLNEYGGFSYYPATYILVHRGEKEFVPWSTGCITIEGVDNMNDFADLVGDSANLVIIR